MTNDQGNLRIIMMGTGPFAVPTFESLLESKHDVVVLVTRPLPKVRTRGKAPANPMREAANAHGIEVLSPDDVNAEAARKQLASLRPDLLVVCDYGQILSSATLAIARLGGINLHGSVLPKYRGASPVHCAILNGDEETGVTVIHMTPKLDGGPAIAVRTTPIGDDETTAELEPRLSILGVEAVHESINLLAEWDGESPIGVVQDSSQVSRAPCLKKSDGEVDWSHTAVAIRNQVRALKPWPGTFTEWQRPNGQVMRLILEEIVVAPSDAADIAPGTVIASDGKQLAVATGCGTISIRKIQPAGKRVMEIEEFLRGYPIPVGARLGRSEDSPSS
ncbi:MAG: methionyl-tRNA formyltransferase [Planctomycetaceae bacterium]|nr:methionyl-tRNA formyltransferase [Planctomycetaceae bacterium]